VLEEERIRLRTDEVIDGHDLKTRCALDDCFQRLPTDATKAVDSDADRH
jgi:hypothetical protein